MAYKNLAYGIVATAPSPATSGTSLVLTTGHGARFPSVASGGEPFYATIFPINFDPDPSTAEIVAVTLTSSDTFTITRAQRGSSARTVVAGDRVVLGFYVEDLQKAMTDWFPVTDTWTYVSADGNTGIFNVNADVTGKYTVGMRVKYVQSSTTKCGIITNVGSYSGGNTPITIWGGTDYTLANSSISGACISSLRSPVGFPMDPAKWDVKVTDTTARSQASPTAGQYYNLGTVLIDVPIGIWEVGYSVAAVVSGGSNANWQDILTTLSTANNSASDAEFTSRSRIYTSTSESHGLGASMTRSKVLNLGSKTRYYLNTMTGSSSVATIYNDNDYHPLVIRAKCALL